jgi:hypothetical protein
MIAIKCLKYFNDTDSSLHERLTGAQCNGTDF